MAGKRKIAYGALGVCILAAGIGFSGVGYSEDGVAVDGGAAAASGNALKPSGDVATLSSDSVTRTPNTPEELQAIAAMELIAENDAFMLYINRNTAEMAVKDKRDGYAWFTNPVGRDNDPIATPLYKAELASQVSITYYNEKGQLQNYNSFTDSVQKGQFKIEKTDKGAKIVFQFGETSNGLEGLPKVISKQRFEEKILNALTDEAVRKDVEFKFSFNKEKQVYVLRKLQPDIIEELRKNLESVGYTAEEAAKDNAENAADDGAGEEKPQFTVPVEYSLDKDQLVVKVAASEIKETKTYPIASMSVLKYFGAAGTDKEGYIFVPDGSGALIRLNSKKLSAEPYNLPVYGPDQTYDVKEKIQYNETSRLPVFGLKQNDHAFIGVIESGDALANVTADISGRYESYNSVSSKFQMTAMDFYTLTSGTKSSSVPMFQRNTYQGDIQLRYSFLSGKDSDYVGMAARYRDYLVGKFNLKPLDASSKAPFMLEVEGAFRKKKSFLGIPYESTEALTRYDEAVKLLEALKERGVSDVDLRYVGWFNSGIRHSSPDDISLIGGLGGKSDFNELTDYAKKNGIGFYPDVAFLEKYKGTKGAAYFLDRRRAEIDEYNPVMYVKDTAKFSHYVLSPSALPGQVDGFLSDFADFGVDGVSLRDMGDGVNSDFDADQPIGRQDALNTIVAETAKIKKNVGKMMVSGGNAYTLPYANAIVGAPTKSSRMNITDEDVPFYQIALHGYFDIAGAPFNMDQYQNPRLSMLKALETGSNVYFEWYYNEPAAVKDTAYNDLYALHFEDWIDEAADVYKQASVVLNKVRNQPIVSHTQSGWVTQTTFADGTKVIVNYGNEPITVEGVRIEAQSYKVGGE